MTRRGTLVGVLLATTLFVATAGAAAGQTIAELASSTPNTSVLVKALTAANLIRLVDDSSATLTVFAPTDAAWVRLARSFGYRGNTDPDGVFTAVGKVLMDITGGEPMPLLTSILRFHVAEGRVSRSVLVREKGYTPVEGPRVRLGPDERSLIDGAPRRPNPRVVTADVQASNGIIHLIDGIMLPAPLGTPRPRPAPPRPSGRPTAQPSRPPSPRPSPSSSPAPPRPSAGPSRRPTPSPRGSQRPPRPTATGTRRPQQPLPGMPPPVPPPMPPSVPGQPQPPQGGPWPTNPVGFPAPAPLPGLLPWPIPGSAPGPLPMPGPGPGPIQPAPAPLPVPGVPAPAPIPGRPPPRPPQQGPAPAPGPAPPMPQPFPPAPLPGQFPPLPAPMPGPGGQPAPGPGGQPAPGQGPGRPLPIGPGGPATIAAIISAADGFAVLGEALEASGLLAALGHPSAVLTVFAPTDAAFVRLARVLGYAAASDHPTPIFNFLITTFTRMGGGNPLPILQRILSYHIVPGRLGTRDLAGNTVRTVEGGLIAVRQWLRVIDLAPAVRMNAQIAPGDLGASNGVVHVIDAVLLPFPVCPVNRVGYCRAIGAQLDQRTCSCVRRF